MEFRKIRGACRLSALLYVHKHEQTRVTLVVGGSSFAYFCFGTMTASSAAARAPFCTAVLLFILSLILCCSGVDAACQSCLLAAPLGPFFGSRNHASHLHVVPSNKGQASWALGAMVTRHFLSALDTRYRIHVESSDNSEEIEKNETGKEQNDETSAKEAAGAGKELTAAMVASIGFYKRFISPLLPPACRFLPTCSQYGVQAIEQFGPTKGAILTAWRLLRCSPIGGRGYDPPRWPPVAFNYGSY